MFAVYCRGETNTIIFDGIQNKNPNTKVFTMHSKCRIVFALLWVAFPQLIKCSGILFRNTRMNMLRNPDMKSTILLIDYSLSENHSNAQ